MLDHGRIVAHGDHEQLLEVSELYREIVEKGLPDQVFLTREPRTRGERDMSRARRRTDGQRPGLGRRGGPSGQASAPRRARAGATCAACCGCWGHTACG